MIEDNTFAITAAVILAIVLGVALAAGLILHALASRRRRKSRLSALAEALGAKSQGAGYVGLLGGTPYRYWQVAASKNTPPSFHVSIECTAEGEFKLVRESGAQRFFKRIGVSVEVQTGDLAFDQDVYVLTDFPGFVRDALIDAGRRQAVRRLLELKFTEIEVAGGSLEARIRPLRDPADGGPAAVEEAVRQLKIIGRGLDQLQAGLGPLVDTGWKGRRAAIYAIAIGSAVAGLITIIWGANGYRPLDGFQVFLGSLQLSLPALVVFAMLAVMWLRGRASSHIHLLLNLGIALLGIPALAAGGSLVVNGLLDDGGAAEHLEQVLNKRYSRSKNSTTYYVTVKSWRPGHFDEEITVSHAVYHRAQPRLSNLKVATSPGRLGYEWVIECQLE